MICRGRLWLMSSLRYQVVIATTRTSNRASILPRKVLSNPEFYRGHVLDGGIVASATIGQVDEYVEHQPVGRGGLV